MKKTLHSSSSIAQTSTFPSGKFLTLFLTFFLFAYIIQAQTLIAGWDFQTTTSGGTAVLAAPNTPNLYNANVGTGVLYLNGTNGASTWTSTAVSTTNELNAFTGTALNTASGFSSVTTSPASLALVNSIANGKSIVFKFSMSGWQNLVVSYATQATATGFNTQLWEYSTNGTTWTAAQTITGLTTTFAVKSLTTITALDNISTAYLRVTFTGATANVGNNRLDNVQLNATQAYCPCINSGGACITNTTFNTINYSTAGCTTNPGFYTATGLSTTLVQGQTYPITVSNDGVGYGTGIVSVWIDWNKNFSYEPSEWYQVYTAALTGTINITVPINATIGSIGMRVRSRGAGNLNGSGDACTPMGSGETEDYVVNVVAAPTYDPAITSINVPTGNCFSNSESIVANLCNFGSTNINLATNPVTVSLNVTGPSGTNTYTQVMNSGTLLAYSGICLPVTFNAVDMYNGGNYSLNTYLTLSGLTNANTSNDGLSSPILRTNTRPIAGADYSLCKSGSIPFGQGLSVSGCGGMITDSIIVNFTITGPCVDNIGSTGTGTSNGLPANAADQYACNFANGIIPTLPLGASFYTDGLLSVTNMSTAVSGSFASEVRMNLFGGSSPTGTNLYSPGLAGSSGFISSNFTYTRPIPPAQLSAIFSSLSGGSTLNMGYWESYNDNAALSDAGINSGAPSVATLKIYYQYSPASYAWYDVPSGGTSFFSNSLFNPLLQPNGLVNNTNVPGTYTFYAACSASDACRVPINFIVNAPEISMIGLNSCSGDTNASATVNIVSKLNILSPTPYQFNITSALFGPDINNQPISGSILYYSNPDLGCNPYPAGTFNGKIALIDRGTCFFEEKVHNAEMAGALGVIIVNNVPGLFTMGLANLYTLNIPAVMVSESDGLIIKNMLSQPSSVTCLSFPTGNSYQWSTGATTRTINNLADGIYSVTVTSPAGCSAHGSVQVYSHNTPTLSCAGSVICNGTTNGTGTTTITNFPYLLTITPNVGAQQKLAFTGANFGPNIQSSYLSGDIMYYANPDNGCNPYPGGTFNGKIALIDRGSCTFEQKVHNAEDAGALGVIIVNNVPDPIFTMGAANLYTLSIPAIMVSQADGQIIKNLLTQPGNVNASTPAYQVLWYDVNTYAILSYTTHVEGLAAGTYAVQVVDLQAGTSVPCYSTCTINVEESAPVPVPSISPIGKSFLCNDAVLLEISNSSVAAISLNGAGQWVDLGANITNLNDADFTIEAWVRTGAFDQGLIVCSNNDNIWEPGERALYLDSIGRPTFVGWGNDYIVGTQGVNDNAWHHIAVTWNYFSGTGKIYVDGNDRTGFVSYHANGYPNIGTFSIGRANYGETYNYFNGEIDEVKIWNSARTLAQIKAGMYTPIEPADFDLRAYYRFNEGDGLLTRDEKSAYHAALSNQIGWVWSNAFNNSYGLHYSSQAAYGPYPRWLTGMADVYTATITTPLGCISAESAPFVVTNQPTISASGPTTFCDSGSVTLSVDPSATSRQFASSILGMSSQYDLNSWGAIQALRAPDVYPNYGDIGSAWASGAPDAPREFLELGFLYPQKINYVDIYETFAPGAVDSVFVRDTTGAWMLVYAAPASAQPPVARINHISFPTTTFDVNQIRIAMNSLAVPNWNEIDAVAIGAEPGVYWSTGATSQTITINNSGNYHATITTSDTNCVGTTNSITVIKDSCSIALNLRVLIEGYYTGGGTMTSVLYNQGVSADNMISDAIEVDLYNANPPFNFIEATTAMLDRFGYGTATFNSAPVGNYFVVIRHRNALLTLGANPISLSTIPQFYDFTNAASQAYGSNMKEVSPGVWALYSGDFNQDENIDLLDASTLETDINDFQFGYMTTDVNGDGNVDLLDNPILDVNVNNFIYSMHP